jgi:hypothetical protein
VGLGHAVRVQQDRVVGFEVEGAQAGGTAPQAERHDRLVGQLRDDLAAAQQQRRHVPGTGPFQPAGVERELADDAGGERIVAEMIRERLIDGRVNVGDRGTIPARVPIGTDGKPGQQRRGDAVAHTVEDREIQVGAADRVIERVSGDVVGGFK